MIRLGSGKEYIKYIHKSTESKNKIGKTAASWQPQVHKMYERKMNKFLMMRLKYQLTSVLK